MRAVLTYHSIDTSGSAISIAPDVFEEHAQWLSSGRVRVRSLMDVLAAPPAAGHERDEVPEVAVTFDDGFANTAEPIRRLLGSGVAAAVFVVTEHVGRTNAWRGHGDPGVPVLPLLDWAEIEDLVRRGATIGAHTRTHPRLPALEAAAIAAELDGCQSDLRAHLAVEASSFAYPYGAVDGRVTALASARFAASFTTRFAPIEPPDRPALVPRLDMYYFRRPGDVTAFGRPGLRRRLRWIAGRRYARTFLA